MHYAVTVALPGSLEPEELLDHLTSAMEPFDENLEVAPRSAKGDRWAHTTTEVLANMARTRQEIAEGERQDNPAYWAAWAEKYDRLTAAGDTSTLLRDWDGYEEYGEDGYAITTRNPEGYWDYWRVGGRWANAFVLKDETKAGPLQGGGDWDSPKPDHDRPTTDSARLVDIEPESIKPSFSYLDLDGKWETKERWDEVPHPDPTHYGGKDWEYRTIEQEIWDKQFLTWIQSLPEDTWLVLLDIHN